MSPLSSSHAVSFVFFAVFASFGLGSLAYADAPPATHLVRIPARAVGDLAALELTPVRSIDYGAYALLLLSDADFDRLRSSGAEFEDRANAYTLRLGGFAFDPLRHEPAFLTDWEPPTLTEPNLHLFQPLGLMRPAWLKGLRVATVLE